MKSITALSSVALLLTAVCPARAQYGPLSRYVPHSLDSGVHDNAGAEAEAAYRELVEFSGTPWMRLHFGDCDLGEASYLVLTSLNDGGRQRLDTRSLRDWSYASAIFNGDAVEVELFVAPGEEEIFITLDGATVSDEPGGDPDPGTRSLCNDDDSRTPSADPRVGRLFSSGCTGWLIGNDAVLTAGHCPSGGTLGGVLEFNVPPSLANGTMVPANPNNQYPVIGSSLVFEDGGESHDWAVFTVGANSNTGLLAHDVQGFFKVTTVVPSNGSTLRLTGYGIDNSPLGSGGAGAACCATDGGNCEFNCNSASQTQQTSTGPLDDLDGSRIEHQVDSMPGNSGCPIIREASGFTIGIHTTGGCDSFFSDFDNGGTWFGYTPLFNAVNSFTPPSTRFVDLTSPDSTENGGILRPFDSVAEAVANVPDGGVIRIFAGSYTAAAGNAIVIGADGRSMTLEALLGTVAIGN